MQCSGSSAGKCVACSTVTDHNLDCNSDASRKYVADNDICVVASVVNAPCPEFYGLTEVSGSVNITTSPSFRTGTIKTIGGDVVGASRGLTRVQTDFLTSVGGSVLLFNNSISNLNTGNITTIGGHLLANTNLLSNFAAPNLASMGGSLDLRGSYMKSVSIPVLNTVGGDLLLAYNPMDSVDLSSVSTLRGSLYMEDMQLSSLDLSGFSFIGGSIVVYGNSDLSNIDCHSLGVCLCREKETAPSNCPSRCTWSTSCA